MMDAVCPNCGDQVVDYRTDRQTTSGREVILSWTICIACSHVGLKKWMVVHPENSNRRRHVETPNDQQSRARGLG